MNYTQTVCYNLFTKLAEPLQDDLVWKVKQITTSDRYPTANLKLIVQTAGCLSCYVVFFDSSILVFSSFVLQDASFNNNPDIRIQMSDPDLQDKLIATLKEKLALRNS